MNTGSLTIILHKRYFWDNDRMMLCLDVGNSQMFGGVFADDGHLLVRFRHETNRTATSDQLGIFIRQVLREIKIDPALIKQIGIGSVVPSLDYSLGSACIKYFNIDPFWLTAATCSDLKIQIDNPSQVGADLIATAIAGSHAFPQQNLIIVDFGTATTFAAVSARREFLGAVIQAGIRTSMKALQLNTEQLPSVQIVKPRQVLGRDSIGAIQSGLYYGQIGAIKEIIRGISHEVFPNQPFLALGTGGLSHLTEEEKIFDAILPDLVLEGIRLALLSHSVARHQI